MGSGNGFGDISASPTLVRGGGVRGRPFVSPETVFSRLAAACGGALTIPSQSPLIALSTVSVDRIAFSRVENSTPVRSEVITRLTICGPTCPARGAKGDVVDRRADSVPAVDAGEKTRVKNPVTAPATHSCRNDIRSQNSSGDTLVNSPIAFVSSLLWLRAGAAAAADLSASDVLRKVPVPSPPCSSRLGRFFAGDLRIPSDVATISAISSRNRDLGSSSNHGMYVPRLSSPSSLGHGNWTPGVE